MRNTSPSPTFFVNIKDVIEYAFRERITLSTSLISVLKDMMPDVETGSFNWDIELYGLPKHLITEPISWFIERGFLLRQRRSILHEFSS
jgi:hypothetical protein